MKKVVLSSLLFLGLVISNLEMHAQLVYVSYTLNGKKHRYPILKFTGDKCFWNNKESDLNWRNEPFSVKEKCDYENLVIPGGSMRHNNDYLNAYGLNGNQNQNTASDNGTVCLYDAAGVKIGWFVDNYFYLQTGWQVLDNKKQYFKHKELIYSDKVIAGRSCSDQKFWFTKQADGKSYLQESENRADGSKKRGLLFELTNVQMSKKVAVAIFWWFKMINSDTGPCGFGQDDDRSDFSSPEADKEKIEKGNAILKDMKSKNIKITDLTSEQWLNLLKDLSEAQMKELESQVSPEEYNKWFYKMLGL